MIHQLRKTIPMINPTYAEFISTTLVINVMIVSL